MTEAAEHDPREQTVATLRSAARADNVAVVEDLLADDVQWYGTMAGGGCRSREEVIRTLRRSPADGVRPRLRDARAAGDDRVVVEVGVHDDDRPEEPERTLWFVLSLDAEGRIAELQDYPSEEAVEHDLTLRARGAPGPARPDTPVHGLVPFVHVSDIERSIAFYGLLGFVVEDTYEPHGRPIWASVASEDARLMLALRPEPVDHRAQGVLFYLYARDLAGLRDHLVSHGLTPGVIIDGSPGPKQEMRVTDPDGYYLMVAQIDDETVIAG